MPKEANKKANATTRTSSDINVLPYDFTHKNLEATEQKIQEAMGQGILTSGVAAIVKSAPIVKWIIGRDVDVKEQNIFTNLLNALSIIDPVLVELNARINSAKAFYSDKQKQFIEQHKIFLESLKKEISELLAKLKDGKDNTGGNTELLKSTLNNITKKFNNINTAIAGLIKVNDNPTRYIDDNGNDAELVNIHNYYYLYHLLRFHQDFFKAFQLAHESVDGSTNNNSVNKTAITLINSTLNCKIPNTGFDKGLDKLSPLIFNGGSVGISVVADETKSNTDKELLTAAKARGEHIKKTKEILSFKHLFKKEYSYKVLNVIQTWCLNHKEMLCEQIEQTISTPVIIDMLNNEYFHTARFITEIVECISSAASELNGIKQSLSIIEKYSGKFKDNGIIMVAVVTVAGKINYRKKELEEAEKQQEWDGQNSSSIPSPTLTSTPPTSPSSNNSNNNSDLSDESDDESSTARLLQGKNNNAAEVSSSPTTTPRSNPYESNDITDETTTRDDETTNNQTQESDLSSPFQEKLLAALTAQATRLEQGAGHFTIGKNRKAEAIKTANTKISLGIDDENLLQKLNNKIEIKENKGYSANDIIEAVGKLTYKDDNNNSRSIKDTLNEHRYRPKISFFKSGPSFNSRAWHEFKKMLNTELTANDNKLLNELNEQLKGLQGNNTKASLPSSRN